MLPLLTPIGIHVQNYAHYASGVRLLLNKQFLKLSIEYCEKNIIVLYLSLFLLAVILQYCVVLGLVSCNYFENL